jgi:hypothetical protein
MCDYESHENQYKPYFGEGYMQTSTYPCHIYCPLLVKFRLRNLDVINIICKFFLELGH